MTPRRLLLETLKASAKKVRNGRYFVKRGAINWTAFDFDKHRFAISIQMDDFGFIRVNGIKEATISMEVFARMREQKEVEIPEIDDAITDEMVEDVERIIAELRQAADPQGDAVALRIDANSANIIEAHDVALRVQGVVTTFTVNF